MQKKSDIILNPNPLSAWHSPYIQAATSENTRKAYQSDIRHYENWGGKLPAEAKHLAAYIETHATILNPRTLSRRLVAIKHWHMYQHFPDPTAHPAISKIMAGIAREHGRPKNKARPLMPEELIQIISHLSQLKDLSALRDAALLQIGFFGGLRRSELVVIECAHINWQAEGIDILLPHSKTDQSHEGQYCAIPYGNNQLCPVTALKNWLQASHIENGLIFRSLSKNKITHEKLSAMSVNLILKERAKEAGLQEVDAFSSHSLRRGLATSAARAGAPIQTIMRAGRWKNVNTVMEYIEATARFNENAASCVLSKLIP